MLKEFDFVIKKTERGSNFSQLIDCDTGYGRATHRKAIGSPLTDSIEKGAQERWDKLQKKAEKTDFSNPSVGEGLVVAFSGAVIGTFMPVVVMFPEILYTVADVGIKLGTTFSKEGRMLRKIEKEYDRNKRRRG